MDVLPEHTRRFVRAVGPSHDPVQERMAAYADEHGFPIIGPEAGGVLALLARLTDAESVFEFGSGFGYSATWFLRGMDGGRVVLTEHDPEELQLGREFLAEAGLADRAAFEDGDALATVERYEGPFDVVLVDHGKSRYAEAFDRVRDKVRSGGVVVADNVLRGPVDLEVLLAAVEADVVPGPEEGVDADGATAGIARYLRRVRSDEAFHTVLLPVGSGLAVSVRR
jgi:predicted O-methyltransferase YrrM